MLHVRHACTCMSVRVTRVDSSHTCMCTMYSNTFARAGFHFKTEIALSPKSTRYMRKSPLQSGHIVKNHTHARDRSMHHPFPPKASELVINFSPNCPPNCHIPSYQNPFMGEARVDNFSSFPESCHALFKPRPNDRNMPTQHIATLLGATCCLRLATLLQHVATCWVLLAQI